VEAHLIIREPAEHTTTSTETNSQVGLFSFYKNNALPSNKKDLNGNLKVASTSSQDQYLPTYGPFANIPPWSEVITQ
jgi:hypothetical protein